MPRRSHQQLKKTALSRPGVKKEYDAIKKEFELLEDMLNARCLAGKTKEHVNHVQNPTLVVGRLEKSSGVKLDPLAKKSAKNSD